MSSGLAADTKDRIKQANDIVDLIGSYTELRRQGSNYVCHCPWHDDNRPSLHVNPARQSWVCWVCDIRGDVFDFVMRREGVEFVEAMRILAERAGIPLTFTQRKVEKGSVNDKQTLYQAMAWAEQQFHDFLLQSPVAELTRQYLAERGLSGDSITEFKLGFCPTSFSWLTDRARGSTYSPEILEACDLVGRNNHGSFYDRFRGRLIFPIRDTMQRPIALGGRLVPGVFPEDQEPPGKYINSRETRLFSKSDTLYGLNLVRDQVARQRQLTIVEGYTDVIGAWQAGLRNVVACLGTALNEKHIRLVKRFADRITLVLDGDDAGRKRANEILDLFVANDIDLRILTLPEDSDPFDFVMQQGAEEFQKRVQGSADAIDHKIRVETEGIDLIQDTHLANQALENILSTVARVPSSVFSGSAAKVLRQDQLLTRLARQFQIDSPQIKQRLLELRSRTRRLGNSPEEASRPERVPYDLLDRAEMELIQLIMQEPSFLDICCERISPQQFQDSPLRQLYQQICQCFHDGRDATYQELMLQIEDSQLKDLVVYLDQQWHEKLMAAEFHGQPKPLKTLLDDLLQRFNHMNEQTGNRQAISRLHARKLDEQEETETLEQLLNQTKQRHGLKPPTDG
ncbi:MAG: DNA primase [Mariniblastus sp.]|nr:DNA primase [Mariniblastus sp.]